MHYDKKFKKQLNEVIKKALAEDIASGDITTECFIPKHARAKAYYMAKEACVVCGLGIVREIFNYYDKRVDFRFIAKDGLTVKKGAKIASVEGPARSILNVERVSLNFLSFLSGIATNTRNFIKAVKPFNVRITDTRKTIPLLRLLSKYAVLTAGGSNHRLTLDEMYMLKDNHLKILGGVGEITSLNRKDKQLEIEVADLNEFKQALHMQPDIIMLDNMSIKEIKQAVILRNELAIFKEKGTPCLEASGGITLKNVRKIASCGVDTISIGTLTHSVSSVDISLEVV